MKKVSLILSILLMGVLILQGCGKRTAIEIKGSDTMVNLAQSWTEAFIAENPDIYVIVTGGGSGVGIASLINGDVDIAQSSRDIKKEEIGMARERGINPQEFTVAVDGLSLVVHPDNPIQRLSIEELSAIYTEQITNWRDLGGPDVRIVALSRDRSSGTHVFFLEEVVRRGVSKGTEEFAPSVLMLPSSQAIADEVAQNRNAIGYIGMGYVDDIRHKELLIAATPGGEYIEATIENILQEKYPIARPMYFYTPDEPEGYVQEFIDFVLSEKGQRIVLREEFVPIMEIQR